MAAIDPFQAVRRQNMPALCSVLDIIDVNALNNEGQNLLHEAVIYGNEPAVDELIRRGVDLNQQDDSGHTPLHYAARDQTHSLNCKLLKAGADVNICDDHGNGPLWVAVFNARGKYDTVVLFLEYGADPTHKNKHGLAPVDFADQIQDAELLGLLNPR